MDKMTQQLKDAIERRGWALQAVMGDIYPGEVDFVYTVGNTAVGLPELLVLGVHTAVGGELLNRVNELVRAGTVAPEPGTVIPCQLVGLGTSASLRFGAVAERWAVTYGVMAYNLHLSAGGQPQDVRFLQVVLPDNAGRYADEPGYDRLEVDPYQPDLSEPRSPWRCPYVPPGDLVWPRPGDATIVVPVLEPGAGDLGRREVVPAESLGNDRYRLIRPPVLADWVTTDTEVRATEAALLDLPDVAVGRVYDARSPAPRPRRTWSGSSTRTTRSSTRPSSRASSRSSTCPRPPGSTRP